MLNIIDLEKRWLRYKIKSYIPHVTILISIIIIVLLAFVILSSKTTAKKPVNKIKVNKTVTIKKEKIKKAVVVPIKNDIKKMELHPSFEFMKNMQNSSMPYYHEDETIIQHESVKKQVKKLIPSKEITVQEKPKKVEKQKIIIQKGETKDDINSVLQRFKKNNNPALSLFIARKYYEIGNYHKSYNYALITNQIDQNIEASWIVFAKSLVKLGKRKKAMQTLQEYIKVSKSSNAQLLFEEIKSGKFR